MKIAELPFTLTDWDKVEPVVYPGETGEAIWHLGYWRYSRTRR